MTNDYSPELIFDSRELLVRVDNDPELLHEILNLFKSECPGLLLSLKERISAEDVKGVQTISHTLKGMLLNVSANRAAIAVARLEQISLNGKKSDLNNALVIINSELAHLWPCLDAYAAQLAL